MFSCEFCKILRTCLLQSTSASVTYIFLNKNNIFLSFLERVRRNQSYSHNKNFKTPSWALFFLKNIKLLQFQVDFPIRQIHVQSKYETRDVNFAQNYQETSYWRGLDVFIINLYKICQFFSLFSIVDFKHVFNREHISCVEWLSLYNCSSSSNFKKLCFRITGNLQENGASL